MNKEEVLAKVNEIICDVLDDEDIELIYETTAKDVEDWDSLAHLQIISTVEKEFKIRFALGEINNFKNVGELCDSIIAHLG